MEEEEEEDDEDEDEEEEELYPYLLGCPKSELAGPTSGRKCYITSAFSGIPNKGDKVKAKKRQKNKNKNCPMMPVILPTALQITPTGV